MIETPFTFLSVLTLIASSLVYLEYKLKWKVFNILPSIVILYFLVMALSSLGFFEKNSDIDSLYSSIKTNLLPAMIFLMLLQSDIRIVFKLGKKSLLTFFLASFTISIGFVITFFIFHNQFDSEVWKAFGALSGSWLGGSANMLAIEEALNLEDSKLGYVLLIDSIDYAIWVMILLMVVPFSNRFNRWSGADGILPKIYDNKNSNRKELNFQNCFLVFSLSLVVSSISLNMVSYLPTSTFFTKTVGVCFLLQYLDY